MGLVVSILYPDDGAGDGFIGSTGRRSRPGCFAGRAVRAGELIQSASLVVAERASSPDHQELVLKAVDLVL